MAAFRIGGLTQSLKPEASKVFTHLHLHTPYSFLDGASEVDQMVATAARHGQWALALTDHDSLTASVKFTTACRQYGIKPILGTEITLEDDSHLTLLAQNRQGYAEICRLITTGFTLGGRLTPKLPWSELETVGDGVLCLSGCRKGRVSHLTRSRRYAQARTEAERLMRLFPKRLWVEMQDDLTPGSHTVCRNLAELADTLNLPAVATNNVHYATRQAFAMHDLLRCIKAGITVSQPHPTRPLNSEQRLKSETEMERLFGWHCSAISETQRIAEMCEETLPSEIDVTPQFPLPGAHGSAAEYLRHLVLKGAQYRYRGLRVEVMQRIDHELEIICRLGYADYFLMAWKLVRWARSQGIRVTGRGSAADSCVAYCLQLTDVDVIKRRLPFARFLTEGKTPDIDVDFPSDRRDEVFEHIKSAYGEENVGMVCTYHTYWGKGAVRDLGKVLELPTNLLKWFSDHLSGFVAADRIDDAFDNHAELRGHGALRTRARTLIDHCTQISGFPRHMGTHSSGVVISRMPLQNIAPLQGSAKGLVRIWTLDKDDAESIGAIKLDVLALRMLSAVNDAETDARRTQPGFRYDHIPEDDSATYRLLRSGKQIGVFQFESAAQCALSTRLLPEHFEDLVAAVALIRPGPVRGNVVNRFTDCRNGYARADCLHPALKVTLAKTYGCIVFQEQVNDVVALMTGCSDAEGDQFRKRLTKHARFDTMEGARSEFVTKAMAHHPDLSLKNANLIFDMIEGWSGYGFTEGHAASFALTGYRSAYLSVHTPAEFFSGLMNHQPMGYYSANSLAAEARKRGVRILPVEVNLSGDKCCAEEADSIRLGYRLVSGIREDEIESIVQAQSRRPFVSLVDFCARTLTRRDTVENLLLCGAFDRLHQNRRALLWRLPETLGIAAAYRREAGELSLAMGGAETVQTPMEHGIPDFSPWEAVSWSWRITGVCANAHPFAYLRDRLAEQGILTTAEALQRRRGSHIRVAGINVRPHRPPTRSGEPVLFSTLEDETEILQTICTGEAIVQTTAVWLGSLAVIAEGVIERRGGSVHLKITGARTLRMADYVCVDEMRDMRTTPSPPAVRTYPGTKLVGVG